MDEFRPSRGLLQQFYVNWIENIQTFRVFKRPWAPNERPLPLHLEPYMNWTTRQNGRAQDFGLSFWDLYACKLDIGDEHEWHFVHPLGRGGFGAVALFEKYKQNDQKLLDQIVVKTTKSSASLAVDPHRIGLSIEAALMAQTNDLDSDGMLRLRQFKYYFQHRQWRYYFEYCPYGDLERLRIRYKGYGRYMPELFLWHTFYWLAKTCHQYSGYNAWRMTNIDDWGVDLPDGYLLHCDIKPQNVLLGPKDPASCDPVCLYPIPRMADLGLAEVTALHRASNKASNMQKGTARYYPPEVRVSDLARDTNFYPFADRIGPETDRNRKKRHPISSVANIWCIGAVMFSITTLHEPAKLSDIISGILREEFPMPREGEHVLDDEDFDLLDGADYSPELLDLIKKCLAIKPEQRPSEVELIPEVIQGYLKCLQPLKNQGYGIAGNPSLQDAVDNEPDYKLYFRGNEIDDADDNYQFAHPDRDYRWWSSRFVDDWPWVPPHWGHLYPADMPINVDSPSGWPQGFRDYLVASRQAEYGYRLQTGEIYADALGNLRSPADMMALNAAPYLPRQRQQMRLRPLTPAPAFAPVQRYTAPVVVATPVPAPPPPPPPPHRHAPWQNVDHPPWQNVDHPPWQNQNQQQAPQTQNLMDQHTYFGQGYQPLQPQPAPQTQEHARPARVFDLPDSEEADAEDDTHAYPAANADVDLNMNVNGNGNGNAVTSADVNGNRNGNGFTTASIRGVSHGNGIWNGIWTGLGQGVLRTPEVQSGGRAASAAERQGDSMRNRKWTDRFKPYTLGRKGGKGSGWG